MAGIGSLRSVLEERTETIDATPSAVWAALTDVERWPDTMRHIRRITRIDEGPFGLGSQARIAQPGMGSAIWTVDEFEPGVRFRWHGEPAGMQWTADHVIEPDAVGCQVTLTVTASGSRARLLGPIVRAAARRALREEIAGLRTAATR